MSKTQINIKLDPIKDQDIIDYLENVPKTWVVKQAIRLLITQEKGK